jgi:hypothetical protein
VPHLGQAMIHLAVGTLGERQRTMCGLTRILVAVGTDLWALRAHRSPR